MLNHRDNIIDDELAMKLFPHGETEFNDWLTYEIEPGTWDAQSHVRHAQWYGDNGSTIGLTDFQSRHFTGITPIGQKLVECVDARRIGFTV